MMRRSRLPGSLLYCLLLSVIGLGACGQPSGPVPESQRLVDVFEPGMVEGHTEPGPPPTPMEWRFDGTKPANQQADGSPTRGWEAAAGIAGLRVAEGRLVGQAVSPFPVLHLERTTGLDDGDPLYEVQVRMKATAGRRVSINFVGEEADEADRAIAAGKLPAAFIGTMLNPDGELATYHIRAPVALRSADIHQIYLLPTDAPGATFEIESIRLIFQSEFLAGKETGIGWEGLSDIYHETLLTRSPEVVHWPVKLPSRPQLEVSFGTLDERPVNFRVIAEGEGGKPLLERRVTSANQWQEEMVDLDDLAGREVNLRLELGADEDGVIGLWGAPVVRQRIDPAETSPSRPQGVVVLLADTLRPDRLSTYGHDRPTSPLVDQLAREGALFGDVVAQAPWTKVSMASLLTSLYPSTVGVFDIPDRVPNAATTLAEAYRQAGYATFGLSSVSFTGKLSNLHQGYETLLESVKLREGKTARPLVDRLLPWLESHRDVPFFVFLHVFDPHSPYEPAAPYNSMWLKDDDLAEHRREKEQVKKAIADPMRRFMDMPLQSEVAPLMDPAEYLKGELAWYDGSIRGMDDELSRVVTRLHELGVDQRSLVAFTSDHGEEFFEHGWMFHGQTVYGELVKVPLVLRYPGVVPAGAKVDETVELIDLMPTLLDLSGLPIPEGLQGQSLVPLLPGDHDSTAKDRGSWRRRPAISQRPPMMRPSQPPLQSLESTALIYEGWKLVHHREPQPGLSEYELFDYRNDPFDQHDVAGENPEVVKRLGAMLAAWRAEAEAKQLSSDVGAENLSPEELERLRSLGYVE